MRATDLVGIKKYMRKYIRGIKTTRGLGREISNSSAVLCKVKLLGTWRKFRNEVNGREILRVRG